ncbi:O-antigen ligase [Marinobacterium halophilum]|uniref:O-antigen ligase n=1 Tax=Marinobacterium halophilum TaxID=267374 RepID=A0A2P8F240_9GAMM|nr:O-antigen ligase family protein [Marinobacterium halophilum]PSL15783.1 O-antigen ligase [Marinobacterium halophilum]
MSQTRSRLESSLIAATLTLLVWLPLPLGSNRDWSAALFCLLTALLCAGWSWLQLSKGASANRALRPALPLFGLLLAVQAWALLQWLTGISTDSGRTLHYFMLGLGYSLLFLLIIGLFHTRRRLTLLVSVLIISATLQAFYGTLMTLSGIEWLFFVPKDSYFGVATGTYVNRNHLAGYLVMTLGLGIGLLLALREGPSSFKWSHLLELLMGPKARLRLGLVIMVIALVMTRSRMGNTAFFASLMIIGSLFVLLNKEHRLRNSLILASLVVIDVLVISQFFGLDKLKDRLINTRVENVVDGEQVIARKNELRLDVFDYAWEQFNERPLTGFGAGSFETSFQQYPGPEIPLHYDHTHNDYLQFAIEYGLIGFIPLAAFVLLSLYHALRALWRRESWYRSGMGFGAAMGILGILIHSSTDFNLQIPANAATFVTLCAIAVLAGHHRKTRSRD